jgi:P27 family predicted phage terminase small subunit
VARPTQYEAWEKHQQAGEGVEAGRPSVPKGLSKPARKVFKNLCRLLAARRVLTGGDVEILRLYAMLYDRHARAAEALAKQGEVVVYTRLNSSGKEVEMEKQNLWFAIAKDSEKQMVGILDRLGLTPHNRDRVKRVAPKGDGQEAIHL